MKNLVKHRKYLESDILFYIPEDLLPLPKTFWHLKLNADVIINTRKNTILKCRQSLEDVFDGYYKCEEEIK